MNDFINPKSTITPAIAASVVIFLSTSIYKVFPELEFRYLAVIISFLIGGFITFGKVSGKIYTTVFYWLVNSVVIFAIGVGAGQYSKEIAEYQKMNQVEPNPKVDSNFTFSSDQTTQLYQCSVNLRKLSNYLSHAL